MPFVFSCSINNPKATSLGVVKTAIPVEDLYMSTAEKDMNNFHPSNVGAWAYVSNGSPLNSAFYSWHCGFSFNLNGSRIVQIAFDAQDNSAPKSRHRNPNTGEWSAWSDI